MYLQTLFKIPQDFSYPLILFLFNLQSQMLRYNFLTENNKTL